MALLLAMYQKMRLIRKVNQAQLKLTRITSKIERVQKNIQDTQKKFTSMMKMMEANAQNMKNNASIFYQNSSGLGSSSVNLQPTGSIFMTQFVANRMNEMCCSEKSPIKDKFEKMYSEYMSNNGSFKYTDKDGKRELTNFTQEEVDAFNGAMQTANMQQQQAQMMVQQQSHQYASIVDTWKEAMTREIEAQQDAAVAELSHEETMLELDKTYLEQQLAIYKEEKQSYDQLAKEGAKDVVPKFGLA